VQTSFQHELLRVIIHGILHLMGYDDKDDLSKSTMRMMEDKCLSLYFSSFHKE
jgi:rRNA maturation RNase YbeY